MKWRLNDSFLEYDCDKSSNQHCYNLIYDKEFGTKKDLPLNILEVGLGKEGRSTRSFLNYFPRAQLYVIDDFSRVQPQEVDIIHENRVHWLHCDSTDPELQTKLKNKWGDVKFDFIIDDGCHKPEWNEKTFMNLFPLLYPNGVYFIEDVFPMDDIYKNGEKLHPWVKDNINDFTLEKFYSMIMVLKENSTSVNRFDLRKESKLPDSVLIKIVKQ